MSNRPRMLIVYGTGYGQTTRVVRRIAAVLTTREWHVTVERGDSMTGDLALDRFDAVLISASVIRGRHQAYIEEYVRHNRTRLNAMPSAFISVSGAAGDPRPERQGEAWTFVARFLDLTAWRPTIKTIVGGALAYTRYPFFVRWGMRMIAKRKGQPTDMSRDHEFTNWPQLDLFVEGVDRALRPAPVAVLVPSLAAR